MARTACAESSRRDAERWWDRECKSIDALGVMAWIAMSDGDDSYIDADPYSLVEVCSMEELGVIAVSGQCRVFRSTPLQLRSRSLPAAFGLLRLVGLSLCGGRQSLS